MAKKNMGIESLRLEFLLGAKAIIKAAKAYCDGSILGIDPARGSTGWAFRYLSKEIATGNISPNLIGFSKVIVIEKQLKEMLEKIKPFVAIEGYAMNARFGREAAGELGGVIRRLLYYRKRPLLVVSPLTIKAWIQAKGKDQIMLEILDRYGVKISNNDAADAFVLQEICHKALLMSEAVVKNKIAEPEEVRLFLKNEDYKKTSGLEKIFRYQEKSLFNLIVSQGQKVLFFQKVNYKSTIKKEEDNNEEERREERKERAKEEKAERKGTGYFKKANKERAF